MGGWGGGGGVGTCTTVVCGVVWAYSPVMHLVLVGVYVIWLLGVCECSALACLGKGSSISKVLHTILLGLFHDPRLIHVRTKSTFRKVNCEYHF